MGLAVPIPWKRSQAHGRPSAILDEADRFGDRDRDGSVPVCCFKRDKSEILPKNLTVSEHALHDKRGHAVNIHKLAIEISELLSRKSGVNMSPDRDILVWVREFESVGVRKNSL